jgi:hypothetical protein
MKEENIGPFLIFAALALFALTILVSHFWGWKSGVKYHQVEAVQKGYGVWVAAADGTTTFAWKETK